LLYYNIFDGILEEIPNASLSLLEMVDLSGILKGLFLCLSLNSKDAFYFKFPKTISMALYNLM